MLENILRVLLGTTHTYFVGKLHLNVIAAIGVVNLVMNLVMNVFIAFFAAISVGTSAVVARYIREGSK